MRSIKLWVPFLSLLLLCCDGSNAFFMTSGKPLSSKSLPPSTLRQQASTEEDLQMSSEVEQIEGIRHFLQDFERAWNAPHDRNELMEYFSDDEEERAPFWRDMVAFTWNICTMEGRSAIAEALLRKRPRTHWTLSSRPQPPTELEFWCDISMDHVGTGKAHVRLQKGSRKIATLLTTLYELSARPFQVGKNRIRGQIHGPIPNGLYWDERLDERRNSEDDFVLLIGGGQAGLGLGARLQMMSIPYTILEAGEKAGTAWRKRYPSLHLHDPVWYNHMPYLPFPETWPVLCPRDKVADWMEFYAKVMDLNVKTNCRVVKVQQLDDGMWEATVQVRDSNGDKKTTTTMRAKNVVFCTGNSSHPRVPKFPGSFGGIQLHSSQYSKGGRPFAGKKVVVVGSNNSGFDIAQDLWEQGAQSVTMIQRSPSLVVSTESVLQHGLGPLYRQDAPLHHEDADLVATTMPYKLLLPRWKSVTQMMQNTDKELHQGLRDAGYQLDFGPGGTGLFSKSATEGGGFYINMGCAELIQNGDVSIRYGTVARLEEEAVVIFDKTVHQEDRLKADVVIYATGFDTMDQWVVELCGSEVANAVGRTWGLGLGKRPKDPGPWEGELRNMWKPTTVEGLWFHGGNLAQSRHYSRFLALQIAARYMGLDTPVFGTPKPSPPAALS